MVQDSESLRKLQNEIETFVQSLTHPVVVEDEVELFDLGSTPWRLTLQYDKLLFEAWNAVRSLARRVEDLAYRDSGKLGLFVRRPHGRETTILEFRDLRAAARDGKQRGRSSFRQEFMAMLQQEFPGWKFEHVSNRSDREHSFSTWYTRGLARQGRSGWAFIGLGSDEPPAAAGSALAFGLIWLDWLRSQSEKIVVSKLCVYLPREAVEMNAQRTVALNSRAMQLELFEWKTGEQPRLIDLSAYQKLDARLVPRRALESLVERHRTLLQDLLGDDARRLTLVPDTSGAFVSVRVNGLEAVRIEGDLSPRVYFGLEGSVRRMDDAGEQEFRNFIATVLERRSAEYANTDDPFYRLQPERWLESMLVADITKIDPSLSPEFVYPQVPAFSKADRGVIDILTATRDGRLAVVELKLQEEINLPFQALDYWLRVEGLRGGERFQKAGYFQDLSLRDESPLLYLVVPAFRFHSTTTRLLRYLDVSITVMQIGVNDKWRQGVKVLFRRELHSGL